MKNVLALLCLIACAEPKKEELLLEKEFYSWTCKDYENSTEIIVTTETCESNESGLHFLIAEAFLIDGTHYKRHLTEDAECEWSTKIVFIDEVCIQVDGVTLTAIVDEPSIW